MNFFKDKKKIKAGIEQYVDFLKSRYEHDERFPIKIFQKVCEDAGIELLQNRYMCDALAFKFDNGPRGVLYDPTMPSYPLGYNLTKKISHHLLGHFERKPPIYLVEAEAHYFAAAVINVPLLTLRCIYAPPLSSYLITRNKIKQSLAKHYSIDNLIEKPLSLL